MSLPHTLVLPNTKQHHIALLDHGPLVNVEQCIIHINDGTTAGTLSWWAQKGHEADGAHVQVSKDATCYQTLPLNRMAWHCPPVNPTSIGFEHEGYSRAEPKHRDDSRPHAQMHASANRVAWVHHECKLGRPRYEHHVFPHAYYPAGGHPLCPGPWDWDLYMDLCMKAYMDHWGR